MSRIVKYTPVSSDEAVKYRRKKTPLTEMLRIAGGDRNVRSAQMTLDMLRSRLIKSSSLEAFDAAEETKGIFGWLERRRSRGPAAPIARADATPNLKASPAFAASRRPL